MKLNKKTTASLIVAAGLGLTTYSAHALNIASTCPTNIQAGGGCSIVFTYGASGGISTTITGVGPYDSSDDILVGVVNNSSNTVNSLGLSGYSTSVSGNTQGIFSFDYDGPFGSGSYAGPNISFSNITTKTYYQDTGTVNFTQGLAGGGGTAYFALEAFPNGINTIAPTTGALPEPSSLALVGLGVAMLGFVSARRKRQS